MNEYRINMSKTENGFAVLTVMRVIDGMFSSTRVEIKKTIIGDDAVNMWKILTGEEVRG